MIRRMVPPSSLTVNRSRCVAPRRSRCLTLIRKDMTGLFPAGIDRPVRQWRLPSNLTVFRGIPMQALIRPEGAVPRLPNITP